MIVVREDRTTNLSELPNVVRRGQCMGCGFCTVHLEPGLAPSPPDRVAGGSPVAYQWLAGEEHWGPVLTPEAGVLRANDGRRVCPGAVMDMPALADAVFGRQPLDPMLGEARRVAVGYASDPAIRSMAASGGISTALLSRLFEDGAIELAYCTAGRDPKNGGGMLAHSPGDLASAMGSHYHPVAFGAALTELVRSNGRFAFVGLPCEIAGLREVMLQRPDLARRSVLLIGLFCGGINRFSGIGRYLRRFGIDPEKVRSIDYRNGDWPGQISAQVAGETPPRQVPRIRGNTRWGILQYMISFQGYWMLPRCRICPDQIADFADISVGDPHLPRFKQQGQGGFSAIIARTERGATHLAAAESAGAIELEELSRDELIQSQGYTLENRRHALVYATIARRLGFIPPRIRVYSALEKPMSLHQYVYAFVDLAKIRFRRVRWLRAVYLPLQVFEYLFLTLSPRLILSRLTKLASNR